MRKYETIIINDFLTKEIVTTVREEDYLKVVEEKEEKDNLLKEKDEEIEKLNKRWGKAYDSICKTGERELIKRDEEIEKLKEELKEMTKNKDKTFIKVLELESELCEFKGEETWTLKYIYDVDGVVKNYEQNGMFKEDAEELIGMDSDNWNHWSLTKEERPDKDKIIEGLLIRCESNEELIKKLEEEIENLQLEDLR